jgi:hypothetical protein
MASLPKNTDLPIFPNAPTFSADDLCKPIDTSLLDIGGSGSTRSEDIALAQSQGLDVDDDNEPAPENIPPAGAPIDSTSNLHGQTWGWGGTCHRKSAHHTDVSPQIKDYTKNHLSRTLSKLEMFLLFFPVDYLENVIVIETSQTLVEQAHSPLPVGEFVRFPGCIFFKTSFHLTRSH